MALPATGTTISINQVQIYYGFTSGATKAMSTLGVIIGITSGSTVNLSASFGGR
jgi:hypothetical protein